MFYGRPLAQARQPAARRPPPATGLDAEWLERELDRNIEALEQLAAGGRNILRALPDLDAGPGSAWNGRCSGRSASRPG